MFFQASCRHNTFINYVLLRLVRILVKSAHYHRHVHPSVFQSPPSVRIVYMSPAFAGGISIKFDIGENYKSLSRKLKFVSNLTKTLNNLPEHLSD